MAKKLMDYAEDFEHIAILKQAQKHQYKLELEFNGILDCRQVAEIIEAGNCLLYTSPSPRDQRGSRMPSSA